MAIIKCKMCGGDLTLTEGQSVCECEYCGSRQTVPTVDNEKKLTLFGRANRLRLSCDFDKAAGIYESIVADFPGEAEAYWGLVLCKYGIEYVDDPGTGKKIPTCHRSSYDSVLEDSNFEQALENADAVAQKVYREEAKHFERLRKGILEVSSGEKPYDIFICYKETDEFGDRTLDSVLAQELYMALTDKGYRVFFSRITLKGKLGEAYEPYIFAALNSAKVMLAVGTCYEYYNAVWVKNEWSRYLKICQQDREKHLIPCYKNLDPEDMPREFSHLQGADLGQMGAIQDILINMEKYIPLNKNTVVLQERVSVGAAGGSRIESLLDRGNMALEDGDWAKADSFFEDVLNNDSKNAQAYLGKALVAEKCRTVDALVRKRREAHPGAKSEKLYIPARDAHIREMAEKYSLPGYLEAETIRRLYNFDLSYTSETAGWEKHYRDEENWWQSHKQLSRAEQFAAGPVAENLQTVKQQIFGSLAEHVEKAKQADAANAAQREEAYAVHIAAADRKAEKLHSEALARREADYEQNVQTAKNSEDPKVLGACAAAFEMLGDFRDSKQLAEHCRTRSREIRADILRREEEAEEERRRLEIAEKARQAEEEERRIIAQRRAEREAKEKKKKIAILITAAAVALVVLVLVITKVIVPSGKYKNAVALMDAGEYEQAMQVLDEIVPYKDSEAQYLEAFTALKAAYRAQADAYLEQGDKINASIYYAKSGDHVYAKEVFDINTKFAVDEYIIAGIMKDGTLKYGSNNKYDDASEARADLNGVVELVAHTTEGINGLDASGKLLTHKISNTNQIEVRDSMHLERYSGIRQVVHGIQNEYYVVMLLEDGRVVCASEDGYQPFPDLSSWKNIKEIQDYHEYILGIDRDGKVHIAYARNESGAHDNIIAESWPAVKAVYFLNRDFLVGLTLDNKLVISNQGKSTVPEFITGLTDVVDLQFTTSSAIFGTTDYVPLVAILTPDGRVTLYDYSGERFAAEEVDAWREVVSIQRGLNGRLIGITHKGTIVSCGEARYADWTDIVAVQSYTGYCPFSVGVKADGTLVTTSDGSYSVAEKVTGANGKTSYVDRKREGGTFHLVEDWDLW